MAIRKTFNGQTILKPGAYSRFKVDNSAGSAIGSNDTLFIVGESDKGAPGSVTGIVEFSASRLDSLISIYGSGPLVDAAVAAARPSLTPGIGGVGKILVWKTNTSTQAAATLLQSASSMLDIKGAAYGSDDNRLSIRIVAGSTADQRIVSVLKLADTTEELGENAAQSIISVQYTGDATTAALAIAGASRSALTLTTTLAGDQTDSSADLSIPLQGLSMKELVDTINAQTGYTASAVTATQSAKSATELDPVSVADVTVATSLKRLQQEILELINTSNRVEASEAAVLGGLPDAQTLPLAGGAKGASTNSSFSTGFANSLAEDYNVLLPCISRDASEDIADAKLGTTDTGSTYTLSAVIAAASAHLSLRGSTKNRKEAQGMVGVRKATKADAFNTIAGINDFNIQACMQDGLYLKADGSIGVAQPHVVAAMLAGVRLGSTVGEPLTNKLLRLQQIGHIIDPDTLLESGDLNTALDADEAIESGVTLVERRGNGFRIVVDNTTYGDDGSFIFNRGSVVEASYFVMKDLRQLADEVFIGNKTSNGLADSIKNAVRNRLRELNQPDVQIITSSDDAPEGFVEDTFVVTIEGNCARVQVEFKPVQGLDFVKFDFTLGDITQTA